MKFKYFILGCLFSVIIFIFINILIVLSRNEDIIVKEINGYGRIVTDISSNIDKIKDENCKSSFKNMLDFINKTHYSKNVSLKDYYNNYYGDKTFIDHFYLVKDECKLDGIDDIYILALSSTNYPEEIKVRYNLKHEFILKDRDSRKEVLKEQDEVGTYTTKILELRVIQELIKEAKK